jgi:hypothetical protein
MLVDVFLSLSGKKGTSHTLGKALRFKQLILIFKKINTMAATFTCCGSGCEQDGGGSVVKS